MYYNDYNDQLGNQYAIEPKKKRYDPVKKKIENDKRDCSTRAIEYVKYNIKRNINRAKRKSIIQNLINKFDL